MGIVLTPALTTNATGFFGVKSEGYIQGMALPDPAMRYQLRSGLWTPTTPFWGGMGITELVPTEPGNVLGGNISLATNVTASTAGQLTGFSVFDQASNMVMTTQQPVPLGSASQTINYYRFGSRIRIPLPAVPSLVSLEGEVITTQVSWDYVGQQVVPYTAAYSAATPNAYTSHTSSTGILVLGFASAPGPVATSQIALTGFTGPQAVFNGSWTVASTASAGTVLNIQVTAGMGTISLSGAAGTLVAGGGAIPCKINDVEVGNSKTVVYNSATGVATWNNSGTVVVIEL